MNFIAQTIRFILDRITPLAKFVYLTATLLFIVSMVYPFQGMWFYQFAMMCLSIIFSVMGIIVGILTLEIKTAILVVFFLQSIGPFIFILGLYYYWRLRSEYTNMFRWLLLYGFIFSWFNPGVFINSPPQAIFSSFVMISTCYVLLSFAYLLNIRQNGLKLSQWHLEVENMLYEINHQPSHHQ